MSYIIKTEEEKEEKKWRKFASVVGMAATADIQKYL